MYKEAWRHPGPGRVSLCSCSPGVYSCIADTTILGTADVLLSNGKTYDTGYSHGACEAECASKSACASFVYVPATTYCELWSKTTGSSSQSETAFCAKPDPTDVEYTKCIAGHDRDLESANCDLTVEYLRTQLGVTGLGCRKTLITGCSSSTLSKL